MLILTRKPGESLYIGDNIKIVIVEIKGHQIRVGIEAPPELRIYREEIYVQILEENKKAAEAALVTESGLESLGEAWKNRPVSSSPSSLKATTHSSSGKPSGFSSLSSKNVKGNEPEVVMKRKKKDD